MYSIDEKICIYKILSHQNTTVQQPLISTFVFSGKLSRIERRLEELNLVLRRGKHDERKREHEERERWHGEIVLTERLNEFVV